MSLRNFQLSPEEGLAHPVPLAREPGHGGEVHPPSLGHVHPLLHLLGYLSRLLVLVVELSGGRMIGLNRWIETID